MSLLSLIMKIYYNHSKNLTELQLEILMKKQNSIINKAIQSLIQHEHETGAVLLLLPGTQDLLCSIGESYCILLEQNLTFGLETNIKLLINNSNEYSTYLMKGVLSYFLVANSSNNHLVLTKELTRLFQNNIYESILNWKSLNNCLNLKTVKIFLLF